jgi:putative flippase GtrA
LRSTLYKALVTPVDEQPEPPEMEEAKPAGEKTLMRQVIKFCIVGGTSFVIDTGLSLLFLRVIPWDGILLSEALGGWLQINLPTLFSWAKDAPTASVPILGGLASFIAMFNSFIWNRSWTFRVKGKAERMAQLRRFYTVSILGAIWNTLIFSALSNIIPGHPTRSLVAAKVVAAGLVAVWSFLGQRYYAFRAAK